MNGGRSKTMFYQAPDSPEQAVQEYLSWLYRSSRIHLRPTWTEQDITDEASDDEDTVYNIDARRGTHVEHAPVQDRVVRSSLI